MSIPKHLLEAKVCNKDNCDLERKIDIMQQYLQLIIDLGYDYDGLNYENDLKGLIDEMCRFAKLGRACNTSEVIFVDR